MLQKSCQKIVRANIAGARGRERETNSMDLFCCSARCTFRHCANINYTARESAAESEMSSAAETTTAGKKAPKIGQNEEYLVYRNRILSRTLLPRTFSARPNGGHRFPKSIQNMSRRFICSMRTDSHGCVALFCGRQRRHRKLTEIRRCSLRTFRSARKCASPAGPTCPSENR